MDYQRVFAQAIDRLHAEGRYRVFIDILRNKGSFPGLRVSQAIEGDGATIAHGSREMPVWGQVFYTNETKSTVKLRVVNLTEYVKTLQAK